MSLILIVSLSTSLLTVVMMWQLARKRKSGLYISLLAQPFWAYFNYLTEAWGMYILTTVMTFIAIRGIITWKEETLDWAEKTRAAEDLLAWFSLRFQNVLSQTEGQQYVNVIRIRFLQWIGKIDDALDR
ncbi:hypothetical protein LCGC14_0994120 [marine sediment metagenome]|uniref:Uncharacterized protein n=1 Tax=marine sediment metagenome TaxID=412755 RepID=A0A0F9QNB4_9ZZZZ